MPLGRDQGVGAVVGSPLGWGKLTGKIRRGQPARPGTRAHGVAGTGPHYEEERQLLENIGAVGWNSSAEQVARLDQASEVPPPYPIWHQRGFPMLKERG